MDEKPNRADYADAVEYRRAYDRWRDKNLPSRRARNTDPERHARSREWYAANRESVLEQKKDYFQKNKEKLREPKRKWAKRRYHADPEFRAEEVKRAQAYNLANPERVRAAEQRRSERYHADLERRERAGQYNAVYMAENADKIREQRAKFRKENGARLAERQRVRLLHATPPWLTPEQRREMLLVYERAAELTALTGIKHEVDHVWPLKGRKSCGLHVPWNLQVLPSRENRRKLNREPDDG
jgi:hypothetical protein